ncbi:MAG: helix-turn-helix transcriptional regulator [Sphingobium sp.]
MSGDVTPVAPAVGSDQYDMRDVIGTLGRPSFEGELTRCLTQMFRAEGIYLFHGPLDGEQTIISLNAEGNDAAKAPLDFYLSHNIWRYDPAKSPGRHWTSPQPTLFRTNAEDSGNRELQSFLQTQQLSERVSVCGRGAGSMLGLCLLRSSKTGMFTEEEAFRLDMLRDVAFPLLARHFDLLREDRELPAAFNSLAVIEDCISTASMTIPKREAEVIARMLYGISAEGTALDLGIGKETVISYRKRFYTRIRISGFRELLIWYLGLFGAYRHRFHEAAEQDAVSLSSAYPASWMTFHRPGATDRDVAATAAQ